MSYTSLRAEWIRFVRRIQPNLAVTLGAIDPMQMIVLENKAHGFMKRVQHQQRGRSWSHWSDCPIAVGFFEKMSDHAHLHIALRAPEDLKAPFLGGNRIWRKIQPRGEYYCEEIEDEGGYAAYITKGCYDLAPDIEPFVHKDPKLIL